MDLVTDPRTQKLGDDWIKSNPYGGHTQAIRRRGVYELLTSSSLGNFPSRSNLCTSSFRAVLGYGVPWLL